MEADLCREFGLVNSTIHTIWKTESKLLERSKGKDREKSDFESLNIRTSMRRFLSDLNKREVTMYQ
jgi:hypothetical protein